MASKQYLMVHFIPGMTDFCHACIITEKQVSLIFQLTLPLDKECKLNIHKTFRNQPEGLRLVYRSRRSQMFYRRAVLKYFAKIHRKPLVFESFFLIELPALGLQLYQKKAPAQVFSCEFFENFRNTFFYGTPLGGCF